MVLPMPLPRVSALLLLLWAAVAASRPRAAPPSKYIVQAPYAGANCSTADALLPDCLRWTAAGSVGLECGGGSVYVWVYEHLFPFIEFNFLLFGTQNMTCASMADNQKWQFQATGDVLEKMQQAVLNNCSGDLWDHFNTFCGLAVFQGNVSSSNVHIVN